MSDSTITTDTTICCICLLPIEDKCRLTDCGHEFCLRCLLTWTSKHDNCPVCRQTMTSIRHNIRTDDDFNQISGLRLKMIGAVCELVGNYETIVSELQTKLIEAQQQREKQEELLQTLLNIGDNDEEEIDRTIDNMWEAIRGHVLTRLPNLSYSFDNIDDDDGYTPPLSDDMTTMSSDDIIDITSLFLEE